MNNEASSTISNKFLYFFFDLIENIICMSFMIFGYEDEDSPNFMYEHPEDECPQWALSLKIIISNSFVGLTIL